MTPTARPAAVDPFDGFTHAEWATLAREYLLAGHLVDRAGMPHVVAELGRDGMVAVAIDEWMGASPLYTARMQRALRFGGDDVATMFKGMQLDVGAPPEFLDFRYRVHDDHHGEFHLDHCGALMDVEPMGDAMVEAMCHTIEDPTFEATACASNPRARLTPVHRPPRTPADRHPHCHWQVTIDTDADALALPGVAARLATAAAASVEVPERAALRRDDGRDDYAGPLDADLRMEDFSSAALGRITSEAALQAHLLVLSFLAAAADHGVTDSTALGIRQFTGVAGVVAGRLARAAAVPSGASGLAQLLSLHPALGPRPYLDAGFTVDGDEVVGGMWPCPAAGESLAPGWGVQLAAGTTAPLAAMARALDARWGVSVVDPAAHPATAGALVAWRFALDAAAHPVDDDVTLTAFSTGAAFEFRRTGPRPTASTGGAR